MLLYIIKYDILVLSGYMSLLTGANILAFSIMSCCDFTEMTPRCHTNKGFVPLKCPRKPRTLKQTDQWK